MINNNYIMNTFLANNKEYIDVNDILKIILDHRTNNPKSKTYKSVKSKKAIVESYNLEHVFGRIINNVLAITEKYSMKHGSIFITKELFDLTFGDKPEKLDPLPNLLEDTDLVFFKDKKGNEYKVEMRGERKHDKIYFKVNDLMNVFKNKYLYNNIIDKRSPYIINDDYKLFLNNNKKQLYVTYSGLMNIMRNSKNDIIKEFENHIIKYIYSSFWKSFNKKIEENAKLMNIDYKYLKSILKKTQNISCIYLINVKEKVDGKNIYKYGLTKNLKRRFYQHTKTFGNNIILDKFILIPVNKLYKAETEFSNLIKDYKYSFKSSTETIAISKNKYHIIDEYFKSIYDDYMNNNKSFNTNKLLDFQQLSKSFSDKYCGEHKDLIQSHQKEITEYKHQIELHRMELEKKDLIIKNKDIEIELLELKLKFAKMN